MEGLDTGGHYNVAGLETGGNDDRPWVEAQHIDLAHRYGQARRIDDPNAWLALKFGEGGGGIEIEGEESNCMRPTTVAPSRMAAGGSLRLTRTRKVRVTGSLADQPAGRARLLSRWGRPLGPR